MLSRFPPAVLLTLSALFWGGNFVVGRWAHSDIPPLSLTFVRWLMAALILTPFIAREMWSHRETLRNHFGLLFVLALTGMAMFHSFTYIALGTTEAINAAFVLASMPVVIPVVSKIMGDERLNVRQAAGIIISFVGVGVIVSRGDMEVLLRLSFTPGDLWVLAAVVAWSVYSVLVRRKPESLPSLVMIGACMWIAIIILAPFYAWELLTVGGFAITPSSVLVVAYLALFASIAAFVCWNAGVQQMGANKAGLFIHLIPLFASIFSIIFLGESLRSYHFVGIVPILVGILLTTTAKARAPKSM